MRRDVRIIIASAAPPLALLPVVMALAGFCLRATSLSRDMLVRAATPPGASGKVYDFGGEPRMIFVASAAFMLLTIATVIQVHRQAAPVQARASLEPRC